MRYNKYKKNFHKRDKYPKDEGMTVTVRQVKDKDGNVTSDVNGAMRVLKKRMQNEGIFNELRERTSFRSRGEKKRLQRAAGRRRWLKKIEKLKEQGLWPND